MNFHPRRKILKLLSEPDEEEVEEDTPEQGSLPLGVCDEGVDEEEKKEVDVEDDSDGEFFDAGEDHRQPCQFALGIKSSQSEGDMENDPVRLYM
jgi:hypothetical protein